MCENIVLIKFTNVFFRVFMSKWTYPIFIFFAQNPSWKSEKQMVQNLKVSKTAVITPLLTSCYPTSRKKLYKINMYIMGSILYLSLLFCKHKYMFVSSSSNMVKLGNKCEIQLVVSAWPAFRGQLYEQSKACEWHCIALYCTALHCTALHITTKLHCSSALYWFIHIILTFFTFTINITILY